MVGVSRVERAAALGEVSLISLSAATALATTWRGRDRRGEAEWEGQEERRRGAEREGQKGRGRGGGAEGEEAEGERQKGRGRRKGEEGQRGRGRRGGAEGEGQKGKKQKGRGRRGGAGGEGQRGRGRRGRAGGMGKEGGRKVCVQYIQYKGLRTLRCGTTRHECNAHGEPQCVRVGGVAIVLAWCRLTIGLESERVSFSISKKPWSSTN